MPRFSERVGAVEKQEALQVSSMSDSLRHTIWNLIFSLFEYDEAKWYSVTNFLAQFFLKFPADGIPTHLSRREWLKNRFYEMRWHEVYDFVEFFSENVRSIDRYAGLDTGQLHKIFNKLLQEELSAYRFVDGTLAPIASQSEVNAIDEALAASKECGLHGAHAHIQAALTLLAKRPTPDYRNSIKESISAVEAIAKQLGKNASGLSAALDELDRKAPFHGALKSAFVKLYGYTSDESGIRHAILDDPSAGFDEAKYMLVTCSAFVNFLGAKASTAGLIGRSEA